MYPREHGELHNGRKSLWMFHGTLKAWTSSSFNDDIKCLGEDGLMRGVMHNVLEGAFEACIQFVTAKDLDEIFFGNEV